MKSREKILTVIIASMIFVLLVFAQPNWNTQQLLTKQNDYYEKVSATATNSEVSFGTGVYSKNIIIINDDGTNEIYVNLDSTTATTGDIEIEAGGKLEIDFVTAGVGIICDTGETASVRVIVIY